MTMKMKDIPWGDINADPELNVRTKQTDIESLAINIEAVGLLNPIRVENKKSTRTFEDGEEKTYKFTLVAGFRRHAAIEKLIEKGVWLNGETAITDKIFCILEDELEPQKRLEFNLIENVTRKDLNPIDEARGYTQLAKEAGVTIQTIADMFGTTKKNIREKTMLLTMSEEIQEAVFDERITPSHAKLISKLPNEKHEKAIAKAEALTVKELEKYINKELEKTQPSVPGTNAPEDVKMTREEFRRYMLHVTRVYKLDPAVQVRIEENDFVGIPQNIMVLIKDFCQAMPMSVKEFDKIKARSEKDPEMFNWQFDDISEQDGTMKDQSLTFSTPKAEEQFNELLEEYKEDSHSVLYERMNKMLAEDDKKKVAVKDVAKLKKLLDEEDDAGNVIDMEETKEDTPEKAAEEDTKPEWVFWGGEGSKAEKEFDKLVDAKVVASELASEPDRDFRAEMLAKCIEVAVESGEKGVIRISMKTVKAVKAAEGL